MNKLNSKYLVLADQALFSGMSFITTIWIARSIDAASFGIYSAWILAIYLFVSAVGAWIIQPFQIKYNKINDKGAYLTFIFWAQFGLLIFIAFLINLFGYIFQIHQLELILYFGFGFIFYDFVRKVLLVMDQINTVFIVNLFVSLFGLGSMLYLTRAEKFTIDNFMFITSIIYFSVFIFALFYLKPFQLNIIHVRRHFTYHVEQGKWFFMTAISQWWAGNLFVVASGVYLGAVALGALRLAQSLFGILNVILQTFENYVLPQTASKMNDSIPEGIAYLKNLSLKAAWIFSPILILSFIFAKDILVLAGGIQYADYAFVVQGLSLLYVFIYISQPLRCIIRSLEFNKVFFKGYLITLAFAILFSHLILSNFGLYGVLFGLIVSQLLLIAYWSLILHSKNKEIWRSFISY
ncbi:MAG TPA: hypothetical protein PK622_07000 [Saprospiraceae bacterium]|nr:hypothetical protein [Saprospiraceae bacterium]